MTDIAELRKRKEPLNLAIVYVDPDLFIEHFMGWLEITAFITAQRAGEAQVPPDGLTPALSAEQLQSPGVQKVANDALAAFCMTAALKGDNAAVDKVEAALTERMGKEFPGAFGFVAFSFENRQSTDAGGFCRAGWQQTAHRRHSAAPAAREGELEHGLALLREGAKFELHP